MKAMASKLDERLCSPEYDKKDEPQIWATSFPHILNLSKKDRLQEQWPMTTYRRLRKKV